MGRGGYDFAGISVSTAGDVNGDGFDDVIIGALSWSGFATARSTAYVVFGKAGGFGTVDLTQLAPADGFVLQSGSVEVASGERGHTSVAAAGDVNGDGFDDVIVGAPYDQDRAGAAYVVFGHSGSFANIDLTQLASTAGIIIRGDAPEDRAGWSVAGLGDINGDRGDDVIVGAPMNDDGGSEAGKAYVVYGTAQPVHARHARNDFNGDNRSDLLWMSDGGNVREWLGQSTGGFAGNVANFNAIVDPAVWHVAATGDFNGDGRADILWRSASGVVTEWVAQANGSFSPTAGYTSVPLDWDVAGTGDFNGDGRVDLLWHSDAGVVREWLGQGGSGFAGNLANFNAIVDPNVWQIAGTGDFNADGRTDVLWQSRDNTVTAWIAQANGSFTSTAQYDKIYEGWHLEAIGDFNGDGRDDLLLRDDQGKVRAWLRAENGSFTDNGLGNLTDVAAIWHVVDTGDFNGDGIDDILWRSESGTVTDWLGTSSGSFHENSANLMINVATDWHVQSPFAYDQLL